MNCTCVNVWSPSDSWAANASMTCVGLREGGHFSWVCSCGGIESRCANCNPCVSRICEVTSKQLLATQLCSSRSALVACDLRVQQCCRLHTSFLHTASLQILSQALKEKIAACHAILLEACTMWRLPSTSTRHIRAPLVCGTSPRH